jgi:hypothetical protein
MDYTHARCLTTVVENNITYNIQGRIYEITELDTAAGTAKLEIEPFDVADGQITDDFRVNLNDTRFEFFVYDPVDEV